MIVPEEGELLFEGAAGAGEAQEPPGFDAVDVEVVVLGVTEDVDATWKKSGLPSLLRRRLMAA